MAFFFGGAVAGVLIGALLRFDPPFAGAAVTPPAPPAMLGVQPVADQAPAPARKPEAPAAKPEAPAPAAAPTPATPVAMNVEALPRAPLIPTVDVAQLPQAPAAKHAAPWRPVHAAPHRTHRRKAPSSSVAAVPPTTATPTGADSAPEAAPDAAAAAGILTKALGSF